MEEEEEEGGRRGEPAVRRRVVGEGVLGTRQER